MNIPDTIIKEYLLEKFKDFQVQGDEFVVDSIFVEDSKKHMSINMVTGLWQDFKSKESGNFHHLISTLEGISYQEAYRYLGRKLIDSPEALFGVSSLRVKRNEVEESKIKEEFDNFKKLNIGKALLSSSLTFRVAAKMVLSRGLEDFKFYVCEEGKFSNRLIIPYIYKKEPIYFQARNLSSFGMKYLNPGRDYHGVKSSEILFPYNEDLDYVVITEGPMDAIAMQVNGINATCIQGSMLSYSQARLLKGKKVILSFDNDDAGKEGKKKAYNLLKKLNFESISQVQPPKEVKDWNDFHVKLKDKDKFREHVENGLQRMDFSYFLNYKLSPL